jgi:hypothetical protein
MGKYFSEYKGEIRDWKFKVNGNRHCFYLDNFLIAQIFKLSQNKWACVPSVSMGLDGPVCGFASRHDAAEYALQVIRFTDKTK